MRLLVLCISFTEIMCDSTLEGHFRGALLDRNTTRLFWSLACSED